MVRMLLTMALMGVAVLGIPGYAMGVGQEAPFFGMFREGAQRRTGLIGDFTKRFGIKPSVVLFFRDFKWPFPTEYVEKLAGEGVTPMIGWEPVSYDRMHPLRITLADIDSGIYDLYVRDFAVACKIWGHPILIRWGHEFNVETAHSWSIGRNGRDARAYVR